MPTLLPEVLEPATRLRCSMERRRIVPVEIEIPAGIEAFALGNSVIVKTPKGNFLSASDAADHGLVKIHELDRARAATVIETEFVS